MKAVVSCSGKFHAFHLAEQLHRSGALERLYTTYAFQKNPWLGKFIKRFDKENIPPERISTNILPALGFRAMPGRSQRFNNMYDRWVSRHLKRAPGDVFIGWSGMSLNSMKTVKANGGIAILERGSSHIQFQNELLTEEFARHGQHFAIQTATIEKELAEYDLADYIAVPSGFVKNTFIEKGVPEAKLLHNPYGVSGFFKPAVTPKHPVFTVLYLGRLNTHKGAPWLFEALNRVTLPEQQWQVHFVGAVDDALKTLISRQSRPNWHFLGHKDHYSLAEYISQCHIAVHPSLEEGLSMVIPQMMACGVPVIATTNTGGADIITDGVNGFIVPVRDADAIAAKIELVYEDAGMLQRLSHQAQQVVNGGFTWDDYGDRYYRNLQRVWEEKNKRL